MTTPIFIHFSRETLVLGDFSNIEPSFSSLKNDGDSLTDIFTKITAKFQQKAFHFILSPEYVYTIELSISETVSREEIMQKTIPHIPEVFSDLQFDYIQNQPGKYTCIVIPQIFYKELNSLKASFPDLSFSTSSAQAHATELGLPNTNASTTLFNEAKRALKISTSLGDAKGLAVSISLPNEPNPHRKKLYLITTLIIAIIGVIIAFQVYRYQTSKTTVATPIPSSSPTTVVVASPIPSSIQKSSSILILNSTNVLGLAKKTQSIFQNDGFTQIEIGNLEEVMDNTTIYSSLELSTQDTTNLTKLLSPKIPIFESNLPSFDIGQNKHDIVIVLGIK